MQLTGQSQCGGAPSLASNCVPFRRNTLGRFLTVTMKGTVLVVMVVLVLWTCVVPGAQAGRIYFNYIPSIPLKTFLEAIQRTIDIQHARLVLNVTNKCNCRMACWTVQWCVAAAAVEFRKEGRVECRLSALGPLNYTLEYNGYSSYYFWEAALPSGKYITGKDNYIYYVTNIKTKFWDAWRLCWKIPFHRLVVTTNYTQYHTLLEIHEQEGREKMWVSLFWQKWVLTWGDNKRTSYKNSQISRVQLANLHPRPQGHFQFVNGRITNTLDKEQPVATVVCQGNPLGLDLW